MATYQLTQNAFVEGKLYEADVRNPLVVVFPDDLEPSTKWQPVDAAAKSALESLDKKKHEVAEAARQEALNPTRVVAPVPKPPKRELVAPVVPQVAGEATPDTHERPAPPSVPGTKEQRPQDLGPTESRDHVQPGKHKRPSDKDAI